MTVLSISIPINLPLILLLFFLAFFFGNVRARLIKAAWEDFVAELVPIECELSVLSPLPSLPSLLQLLLLLVYSLCCSLICV